MLTLHISGECISDVFFEIYLQLTLLDSWHFTTRYVLCMYSPVCVECADQSKTLSTNVAPVWTFTCKNKHTFWIFFKRTVKKIYYQLSDSKIKCTTLLKFEIWYSATCYDFCQINPNRLGVNIILQYAETWRIIVLLSSCLLIKVSNRCGSVIDDVFASSAVDGRFERGRIKPKD